MKYWRILGGNDLVSLATGEIFKKKALKEASMNEGFMDAET